MEGAFGKIRRRLMEVFVLFYSEIEYARCIGVYSTFQKARAVARKMAYCFIRQYMKGRKAATKTVNYKTLRDQLLRELNGYWMYRVAVDSIDRGTIYGLDAHAENIPLANIVL